MGRPRKKSLQFSTEDRNELQRIATSRTEPAARVSRARALLAYEDGEGTNAEIASEAGMSTVALANLVNKCITFGPMVALNDLPRSGRKSIITDEDKAYVKHIACYKPKDFGYPEELWSAEKLAKHIREHCADDGYPSLSRINKSMVWKILEESGMKPHRIRYYLENRDPEFHEKMMQVLMVYKETQIAIETEIDTGVVTISYDEKPSIQALGCTAEDEPMTDNALAQAIGSWLYDKKAKDIIALNVSHLTVITDYMVIASGRTTTQVKALADEVDEKMAEAGWNLRRSEGAAEGRWIVMDYGSILVHIFHQEDRAYYNLERLWEDGSNRLILPFDQTVED